MAVDAPSVFRAGRLPSESLEALGRQRLTRLLRAAAATEFYGGRLHAAGIGDRDPLLERDPAQVLAALAPVGKQELREAGNRLLQGGGPRPEWRSSASSGSTGEPFRVYYEPRAWAMLKHLVKLRARYACGMRPADRVVLLDATPVMGSRAALAGVSRVARISVLQPAEAMTTKMAALAPDTVYGLPSALLEVAAVLRARGDRLAIHRIFTSGELLRRPVRDELADAFQSQVFDIYGSSETKEIAWQCPAGGMHVNSDVVRLEVLDEAGQPAADGVEGELVATLLVNRAMPLVRYRLGDRGTLLRRRCGCGRAFPLLGVVTGRQADVLVLAGGARVSPYTITCALERIAGMLRYQVTQLDANRLQVRAIVEPGADRVIVAAKVRSALRSEVAPFLDTEVEFVSRLPTGAGGKFRVVQPLPEAVAIPLTV